jgi:hypothetical protein
VAKFVVHWRAICLFDVICSVKDIDRPFREKWGRRVSHLIRTDKLEARLGNQMLLQMINYCYKCLHYPSLLSFVFCTNKYVTTAVLKFIHPSKKSLMGGKSKKVANTL